MRPAPVDDLVEASSTTASSDVGQLPAWPIAAIAALVVCRGVVLGVALITGQWVSPTRSFPVWVSLLQMLLFTVPAVLLLIWGRSDRRSWALGAYCLDVACTLAEPLVRGFGTVNPVTQLALGLRTDAFQAALVWFFATEFPRPALRPWHRGTLAAGFLLAAALGVTLAAFDSYLWASGGATGGGLIDRLAQTLARDPRPVGADWYFALQYALILPLLVLLPLKVRDAGRRDRWKLSVLLAGLALAVVPIFFEALLASVSPWYREIRSTGAVRLFRVLLFTLSIAALPLAATYAALVHRTLGVSFILRIAAQYLLTRYAAILLMAAPFIAAAVVVYLRRDRPLNQIFTGADGVLLILVGAVGVALALGRRRLLDAIDRRFFRQRVDVGDTLLHLSDALQKGTTLDDLSALVTTAVEKAFHPVRTVISVADDSGVLHAQDTVTPPLEEGSAIGQMLRATDHPLSVGLSDSSPMSRLSSTEQAWLAAQEANVLVPMRGPRSELLGVLALGERKGDLEYSSDDKRLLAVIGAECGSALSRLLSAGSDGTAIRLEPAGRECVECGLVWHADAIACRCGAPLRRAAVPHQLGDRLRFIQRIGAGATGVVYEARDLAVQQKRAVKALPRIDPAQLWRVRREARAMAVATHPNLAILFGVDIWGTSPLLVMEYCERGTLADRLRRGAMDLGRAIDIGIAVADALKRLHDSDVVHRDIKPSNIGFSSSNEPKLLDFGLAKLVVAHGSLDSTVLAPEVRPPDPPSTDDPGAIRGTPPYLSPEVLGGAPPSRQDDLWSLGVTLLEACTGSNPFKAPTAAATLVRVMAEARHVAGTAERLPAPFPALFAELLDPRPAFRPQSAAAFRDCLERVKQGVTHG